MIMARTVQGETMKQLEAKEYYVQLPYLGEKRSCRKVAEDRGLSLATVESWSKKYDWVEYAKQRDSQAKEDFKNTTQPVILSLISQSVTKTIIGATSLVNKTVDNINNLNTEDMSKGDLLLAMETLSKSVEVLAKTHEVFNGGMTLNTEQQGEQNNEGNKGGHTFILGSEFMDYDIHGNPRQSKKEVGEDE